VLDGADAFAIPTRYGQKMEVKNYRGSDLIWESLDNNGQSWFSTTISLYDFSALKTTDETKSKLLQEILKNAVRLNPEFLDKWKGFRVTTKLEFPNNWGLGSSSTLIYLIAQWADVHPLELYFKTFEGSGYDVACAGSDTPIVYWNDVEEIGYNPITFNPSFKESIYFLHLGQKQDTQMAIREYLKSGKSRKQLAKKISEITYKAIECKSFKEFCSLMDFHEDLVSSAVGKTRIQKAHFSDFWGTIKSLGAWGGDFVMVLSDKDEITTRSYFESRGFETLIGFEEMIFSPQTVAVEK
jgi:mevalonate kinase